MSHVYASGARLAVAAALLLAATGAARSAEAHPLVDTPAPPAVVDQPLPGDKRRSRRYRRLRRETAEFLIQGAWSESEAREHGIAVSRRALRRAFRRQKREAFRSERAYRRFLRRANVTERDILYRVKLDLLSRRLQRHVRRGPSSPLDQELLLERFIEGFTPKWRARTACARAYVVPSCSRAVPSLSSPRRASASTQGTPGLLD